MTPIKYLELIESIEDSGIIYDDEGEQFLDKITYTFWELLFNQQKNYHHKGMQNMARRNFRKYLEKNNIKVKGIIDEYITT